MKLGKATLNLSKFGYVLSGPATFHIYLAGAL